MSDAAQTLLSYLMSLKLTASADNTTADNLVSPEFIAPFSKSHWYRTTKIKGQRQQKTLLESSNIINKRVTSSLTVPTADITKLHSSRRTFDTPRSLSSQRLRRSE
jgi:hypothetical protein